MTTTMTDHATDIRADALADILVALDHHDSIRYLSSRIIALPPPSSRQPAPKYGVIPYRLDISLGRRDHDGTLTRLEFPDGRYIDYPGDHMRCLDAEHKIHVDIAMRASTWDIDRIQAMIDVFYACELAEQTDSALDHDALAPSLQLMYHAEVGDRMTWRPGSREWGRWVGDECEPIRVPCRCWAFTKAASIHPSDR